MQFNLFHWLFDDAITAGGTGPDGSEVFHYFWPFLIACGVGLLVWFYYWVEGRKRFVKGKAVLKDNRVLLKGNPILKDMLDRYLNWLAVICFVGIPIDLARVVLDGYFFSWRFWRYLWLVALLVWAVLWIAYLVRKFPRNTEDFKLYLSRQASLNKPNPDSKANPKPSPKQKRRAKRERARSR